LTLLVKNETGGAIRFSGSLPKRRDLSIPVYRAVGDLFPRPVQRRSRCPINGNLYAGMPVPKKKGKIS